MLHYDRINLSEGININKTSASRECIICHYWYILEKGFKFQLDVCNGCHHLLMMSMNLNNIPIYNIQCWLSMNALLKELAKKTL